MASASFTQGVDSAIVLNRFKQSLSDLIHEKTAAEQRAEELGRRLAEQTAAAKAAQARLEGMQGELDEARRGQEECARKVQAQSKEQEDERARHSLHARTTNERAMALQQQLQQHGQQLYTLEDQLRTRTTEVSRLRIDKDGLTEIVATFQGLAKDVEAKLECTAQQEQTCVAAVRSVHEQQTELRKQLEEAQATLRSVPDRPQLVAKLRAAIRGCDSAHARATVFENALQQKCASLDAANARAEQLSQQLGVVQTRLAADHDAAQAHEDAQRALLDQVHAAQANSLRELEKCEGLMRKLSFYEVAFALLRRELAHADANAHQATERMRVAAEDAEGRVRATEARQRHLERELGEARADVDAARAEARGATAEKIAVEQELEDARQLLRTTHSPTRRLGDASAAAASSAPVASAAAPAAPSTAATTTETPVSKLQPLTSAALATLPSPMSSAQHGSVLSSQPARPARLAEVDATTCSPTVAEAVPERGKHADLTRASDAFCYDAALSSATLGALSTECGHHESVPPGESTATAGAQPVFETDAADRNELRDGGASGPQVGQGRANVDEVAGLSTECEGAEHTGLHLPRVIHHEPMPTSNGAHQRAVPTATERGLGSGVGSLTCTACSQVLFGAHVMYAASTRADNALSSC